MKDEVKLKVQKNPPRNWWVFRKMFTSDLYPFSLFFLQQSLQYTGLSGEGKNGNSVISFPHSAHFQFP